MTDQTDHPIKPAVESTSAAMSVQSWMLTLLILAIPLVNIVMIIIWGFFSSDNPCRRNYCRAITYWFLIGIAFYIVLILLAWLISLGAGR